MKRLPISLAVAALLSSPLAMAKTVEAVASFSILGDIVQQVGGEHVNVVTLVGPDGDPHGFAPMPKNSKQLSNADVVFVSGLGLEGWLERLISASGYKGQVVVASTGVDTRKMDEEGKMVTDPHAWNSMANGIKYANNVMNALIVADPEDADYFRKRGGEYIQQLEKLDAYAKAQFAAIPLDKRKVLTSHDAFGYFSQEYGVSFLSPVGFSTEAEASASDVAALIKQIKQEKIKTYFIENQTDPRLVKQIATASGAKAGGELYPEALSPAGGPAATYAEAFKHNVDTIVGSMK
ncbi:MULTISPECIES: metal ABC transporter substrate-binding protein [Yersinia]|jgi:zinc/manganese transport system substrate-binding protein|uniref:Metal ABC transporter substrate-binding protein n=1 Tax=Yersinia intermedia TaxID=631 RepID=A0A0T9M676_YERIN|nr:MULTISPECIES: metal ABC transporter substrate-binding protein [Yersinia]AJJ20936.1 periplasmic solute binding family protein [Yersinia intermedia]ARB86085.1 metal ABC transporter substrate-binding protein [Yersinia sp. FDAARGOS_228]AVL35934.1 metal ABC transporter substrate-binding protein [Yersinia intermedia]EEQ20589.1 Periplasmic solute binding protein [Yersinia intermedia ATCC 29909]MCB5297665.1 metal ABC transporter substrate-binding protein [Yersinia intermedia]